MILQGDCLEVLKTLPDESVHCCVTSPPYWGLRDYGVDGQLGLEETPEQYVQNMVEVFREVRRVLRRDGTLWLNLGDSYVGTGNKGEYKDPKYTDGRNGQSVAINNKVVGLKPKNLVGIPWRVAFALQADGWYLRSDIIWHKPNPMPESVRDRPTKSHEYIFLLSKNEHYYYDHESVKEPVSSSTVSRLKQMINQQAGSKRANGGRKTNGNMKAVGNTESRNRRSVWTVTTKPFSEAHFAVYPPDLIKPCILAGCPSEGTVLDPFFGSGTTGVVALQYNRDFIGIELNPQYIEIAERRLAELQLKLVLP